MDIYVMPCLDALFDHFRLTICNFFVGLLIISAQES